MCIFDGQKNGLGDYKLLGRKREREREREVDRQREEKSRAEQIILTNIMIPRN